MAREVARVRRARCFMIVWIVGFFDVCMVFHCSGSGLNFIQNL